MNAAQLQAAVVDILAKIPERSIAVDTGDLSTELQRACADMEQHGLLVQHNGIWTISEGQETAAGFYANSIAHYLLSEGDAATAK